MPRPTGTLEAIRVRRHEALNSRHNVALVRMTRGVSIEHREQRLAVHGVEVGSGQWGRR
jgi:hypothetical protein